MSWDKDDPTGGRTEGLVVGPIKSMLRGPIGAFWIDGFLEPLWFSCAFLP